MDNQVGGVEPETLTNTVTRLFKLVNEIENKLYGPKPANEAKPVETMAKSLLAQSIRDINSICSRLAEISSRLNL